MEEPKWFQTDLAYEATWNKLYHARQAVSGLQESKGRLTFHLKEYPDSNIQITSHGKLGIYPKGVDYKTILNKVLPFLVKADGSQAKILYEIPIHKEKRKPSRKPTSGLFEWLKYKSEKKRLENSRTFKPEVLPLMESLYKNYEVKSLEPFIKRDKEIERKLEELSKSKKNKEC